MELTGIRQQVFLDRYAFKGVGGELLEHEPQEMWRRVAHGIAQNEKKSKRDFWEKKFYEAMSDFKFVPGGRILSGAGTDYQVTYYNCFVIPSPKDSREGILESLKHLVEIQSRSGGVGLNLSSLRPRGARVKKVNGTSSGPVTWAGLFSYATHDVVQQGGTRRGATMLMLWDWHPDIEEFITVKQDLSKINGANLSVCISDAFMEAVKNDSNWDLVYPDLDDPKYDKHWRGELDEWKNLGGRIKVHKTIKAKTLWDLICTAAWRSAEPGLHFLERSNKRSNTYYFERLVATNPSLRAGTRVLTKEGVFLIEGLEGKKFLVKNLDGKWSEAECFLSGKNKELYKITLNNGKEIYATAEHKWPVLAVGGGFGKITTDKLKPDNILPFPKAGDISFTSQKPLSREQGFMLGWLYGDGWISMRGSKGVSSEVSMQPFRATGIGQSSNTRNFSLQPLTQPIYGFSSMRSIHESMVDEVMIRKQTKKEWVFGFLFSEEDKILADAILQEVNKLKKEKSALKKASGNTYTIQSTSAIFAENLATIFGVNKKENGLPVSVWQSGSEFIKGFIDGLFSSDGFVSKNTRRIIFTTKHKKLAEDVADLLSFYGIRSRIRRQEATMVKFPNRKNYAKIYERYDVQIDGYHAVDFAKIFTLSHPRKQKNLLAIARYTPPRKSPDAELIRVVSVEKTGMQEDVWDVSVYDDSHTFYINHCVTGNCGEQPLGPWAVCNLGAMNMAAYVVDGNFDYESFGRDVRIAIRFLDNVIDKTYYFYKENEKCAKDIRRTGLGVMGVADALIKMNIRYGSEESLPVIEKMFEALRDNAYESSSDIALEKGAFPKFNREKYLKAYHVEMLPDKTRRKIGKNGIRNAVLLTIAPTGTTSLLSGVSSGIEPVYEFEFIRRDRMGEHKMYHPLFEEWKKSHPNGESKRPDYFVSANDLTPLEHAKVQAIAQKYIDSSISKTVNAPNSHTVSDVKELYMAAYDLGLKGVTYMRDGSRAGVLSRVDSKEEPQKNEVANGYQAGLLNGHGVLPRPTRLEGATYKMVTPIGHTFVTINNDSHGSPFEVFITIGKSGSDVSAMAEALGRLISLNLRSLNGAVAPKEKVKRVVDQLVGIGGSRAVGFGENRVRSLPDAVAKILAMHYGLKAPAVNGTVEKVTDETNVNEQKSLQPLPFVEQKEETMMDICSECGSAALALEEGCRKCYSCGYSEC